MVPTKINRYEIRSELRRGGMATVYHAYDPMFEREVAIKVLPAELLVDTEFRARFEREAKTLASLEHPAIVAVYDFGEEDGRLYLVMRYMPGGSLADRLAHGPLSPAEAARIISRLAPALDEAHLRGIIHRDIKPANILFDQRGEPYLSDFGVVKVSGVHTTSSGHITLGTPAYMSPEQARGEPDLDGRSDIYSLGAVLFEMLTGRIPYEADTAAGQLVRRITDPVPNILELRPDLPTRTQIIIDRALAKRPYARFSSASELARAFRAVLRDSDPHAAAALGDSGVRPAPMVTPRQGFPKNGAQSSFQRLRKNPWFLPGMAGGGVLVIVLLLGMLVLMNGGLIEFGRGGLLGGTPPPTASPTSPPAFATVAGVQGVAQMQLPGQGPILLENGANVPQLPGVRLWTTTGIIKLQLVDGSLVYLGENTILLPDSGSVQLERGQLLVKSAGLLVTTPDPHYQAKVEQATLGIYYEPAQPKFEVHCLQGSCRVGNEAVQTLNGGQRLGYEQAAPGAILEAVYEPWLRLGGADVPTPTHTPTPEPSATPTVTETPVPTDTPAPTATQAPVVQPSNTVRPVVVPTRTQSSSSPPPQQQSPTTPPPTITNTPTDTPTSSSNEG